VAGRWEGSAVLLTFAEEVEEALPCEREVLAGGLTFAVSAVAVAAAAAVLCLSAASRSCKGHISVRPLDHEAAAED
jgi:hypothetical protein